MARPTDRPLDAVHDAILAGDGASARRALGDAVDAHPTGEILSAAAQAAYVEHDFDAAIDLYERAYAAYRDEGDDGGAIRAASVLGWLHGGFRGDGAVAGGWMARAQTLLGEAPDSVDRGWVQLHRSMFGDYGPEREERLREAIDIGRRHGDADLEFWALGQLGGGLVHEDRIEEGMVLLDEAMAAVVGGEVKNIWAVENIFCQLYSACELAHDVTRADQWIRVAEETAARRKLPAVAAWCRTHYGGILTVAGRWSEADAELTEAARIWGSSFRSLRSSALIRLATLRVRQGRVEEAARYLEGLETYADAAWPVAAIHVVRGETSLAADVLERALAQTEPHATAAAPLWTLLVDVHLADGAHDAADRAASQVEEIAARHGGTYLRASAALVRGRICLATGAGDPLACFRTALAGFADAQLPVELAHTRLELARAVTDDRPDVAVAEAKAALDTYERLEAARDADVAAALLRALGSPVHRGPRGSGVLTKRESEVLALLGEGLSNPEISDRLYISRKTVEHHVGNVLAKLGLRSRAEAAAYATRERSARA